MEPQAPGQQQRVQPVSLRQVWPAVWQLEPQREREESQAARQASVAQ
jgi:hypothetical protein